ncbi:MAG: hypothetical protein IJC78_05570 [Clostridia bacterium]|nr:hypothetical protein [Clostridia bacterium]
MEMLVSCRETDATCTIQQAIDACFLQGGGEVQIPEGKYSVTSLRLRSNVCLHLLENAQLIASRNCEDYEKFLEDTLEPVPEHDKSDADVWKGPPYEPDYEFFNKPGSRWNRGVIKALDAENISIIGEKGSVINGRDCYDALGEEGYRGPHAINLWRCKNITLSGYTVQNSANWAHAIFESNGINVDGITVVAGHDGIHMTACDNIRIANSTFETGDDCVAGIDNENVYVGSCLMNSSCSALRFGGRNVLIENCRMEGPGKYFFRGSLSEEEKKNGILAESKEGQHRNNMLTAFLYHADHSRAIRGNSGKIVIQNCVFKNVDRFMEYNFSGSNIWQMNAPLTDVTFENITAEGIKIPLVLYGDKDNKVSLTMKNIDVSFSDEAKDSFIQLCHFDSVLLDSVTVKNLKVPVLIRKWSDDGKIVTENFVCEGFNGEMEAMADEPFVCQWI